MRNRYLLFAVVLSWFGDLASVSTLNAETADEVCARALAVLKSDAPLEQKAAACRDLARVGDKDCVPVLAGMLGDDKLSHMRVMRWNPSRTRAWMKRCERCWTNSTASLSAE